MVIKDWAPSRRGLIKTGFAVAGAAASSFTPLRAATAAYGSSTITSERVVRPALFRAAMNALEQHGSEIPCRDRIAIADFAAPSSQPRFHFIDLANGNTTTLLVAHGRGSDPEHTGWLQRFSNEPSSFASSDGAFLTSDYYIGKHGLSQRLVGLDPTNNNAMDRAIVIHSAWYANPDMLMTYGQLGRSEGCFAVGEGALEEVFARLGAERMVFAAKV
ncbi:MAG: murein L,D-transpeptidase catalytic domain family protein [Sphingomonas bacterium]